MAQYPAPPPLRYSDGTLVPQSNAGTQFIQDDGQSFQPVRNPPPPPPKAPAFANPPGGGRRIMGQTIPVTNAPAPSGALGPLLTGLLTKGKSVAGAVGGAIKANPLGAISAGLGVAGAVQYATAQAPPMLGRPDAYAPTIRPAQGLNSSSLEAGRRGIQAAQYQAGRAVGADTGTTSATRLLAQQQAGEQQGLLSLKDNEAYQADQRRVDEQSNQAYDANFKTQRSFEEKRYDLQQRQFEARRQQSAAMSQSALTYFTQAEQGKRQDTQATLEASNRQKDSQVAALVIQMRTAAPAERDALKAKINALAPGYTINALGGRLPTRQLSSTSSRRSRSAEAVGTGAHHAGTQEFGEQMQRITSQAMEAFHASLLSASTKRAKGLRG